MVFAQYAQYYDVIYKNKDYKKECAYLEKLFQKFSSKKVRTILDLGCGTANHMIPLLQRGYVMAGIDASAQMLKIATQKLDDSNLKADLVKHKLQTFSLNKKFDVILCMFSVIDYVTQKKGVSSMLDNVSEHMKKGSLFVFDFWNESAVEGYYSPRKKNQFRANGNVLERSSTTTVFPSKRICEVQYICSVKKNQRLISRDKEKHVLRYFGIDEMTEYLKKAGLEVIDVHPFQNIKGTIKKNTWDVTMVAQKR